jgi:hypothetical protein
MGADWPGAPQVTVACSDRFLLSIHRRRFTFRSRRMESIFNYNNRRLFYSVTNTGAFGYPVGEWHEDAGWQTAQRLFGKPRFPNGVYRLTIGARDWWRNKAEVSLLVNVEN